VPVMEEITKKERDKEGRKDRDRERSFLVSGRAKYLRISATAISCSWPQRQREKQTEREREREKRQTERQTERESVHSQCHEGRSTCA
jgi:hypothetical protein